MTGCRDDVIGAGTRRGGDRAPRVASDARCRSVRRGRFRGRRRRSRRRRGRDRSRPASAAAGGASRRRAASTCPTPRRSTNSRRRRLERFGRVDVVCNNAGVSTFNLLRDQTLDDWRWVFSVNLWGVIHGAAHVRADHAQPGHAGAHRQHRVDRRNPERRRVHRPVLRHEGRGGVDLRDLGAGVGDRSGSDRRERAVPELGRHQGDGVGARTPGRARRRAPHRDWPSRFASRSRTRLRARPA